ncbi:YqjF family protein [Arundinibacter roseus]|uniref:DUF2071 domain-containing protein n=1 Tax=Arundinibacter roseus TaxID=2070510 RepID=A0A4R4K4K0_9BACT|nr:DUF2071 domain-containing protein [Arundinibacter roseus]TDB62318.1 DUF2071 domain-containing protein [Arundinibacter roseus]
MSFLRAEWRKLAFANYEINPEILANYVPAGTELDFWENRCYVSLVGFMFMNTRLLGVKVPFHVNFEEVNLRFYVKRLEHDEWKRGVVFIKEIVPKYALSFVANTLYGEKYETRPMSHSWQENSTEQKVEYRWKVAEKWMSFGVSAALDTSTIAPGSEAEFITEHYWGYARKSANTTNEYQVTHPTWQKYEVQDYTIQVDFGQLYGPEFAFLNTQKPLSVLLAEGSDITVEGKRKISTMNF